MFRFLRDADQVRDARFTGDASSGRRVQTDVVTVLQDVEELDQRAKRVVGGRSAATLSDSGTGSPPKSRVNSAFRFLIPSITRYSRRRAADQPCIALSARRRLCASSSRLLGVEPHKVRFAETTEDATVISDGTLCHMTAQKRRHRPERRAQVGLVMAVPQQLLQQLLALDESMRLEIAYTLLKSVDASTDVDEAERENLYAALQRAIDQADRGETVPFDEVMAALRAKRTVRAAR